MKYQKERKFVKGVFEKAKREIKVSTIKILESYENKDGEIEIVRFRDRFGNPFEVNKEGNINNLTK